MAVWKGIPQVKMRTKKEMLWVIISIGLLTLFWPNSFIAAQRNPLFIYREIYDSNLKYSTYSSGN